MKKLAIRLAQASRLERHGTGEDNELIRNSLRRSQIADFFPADHFDPLRDRPN